MPYKFKVYLDTERAHQHFSDGLIGLLETEEEPTVQDLISDYVEYVESLDKDDLDNLALQ